MLKLLPNILLGIGLLIAVTYGAIYIGTQISMDTAERRGEADKMEQVEANGARRIADYEYFHNTCQDINAQTQKIEQAKASLSGEREQEVVFALEATRTDTIADYNAKAAQDYTSGQFRDSDLPYEISENPSEVNCG